MPANNTEIEKRLWDAADELRANSKLKSSEYSVPVLGRPTAGDGGGDSG
jgi:type I restriction enzyme M protein